MARFIYSQPQLNFIRDGFKDVGIPELTIAFNKKFGASKTPAQIKSTIKNHGFTCGRKTGQLNKGRFSFTPAQIAFIKKGYQQWTIAELTAELNAEFGTEKKESQIRGFTRNHGIKSGRSGHFKSGEASWNAGTVGLMQPNSGSFKKGLAAHNHRLVGAERVNVDGYIEIKVSEPNLWQQKHRVVYEAEHGPIPTGHNVRFRDGVRTNCDIDNLFLVDNHENALLNQRYKLNHQPLETRDTLVLMARVDAKVKRLTTTD